MKKEKFSARPSHQVWAEFRFAVIGVLLSDPPNAGELKMRLKELSETEWKHPLKNKKFKISLPTLERWYYLSRKRNQDPVGVLRRKLRRDCGTTRHLTQEIKNWLQNNYRQHQSWSVQLHNDNLQVWLENNPSFGMVPSYATILRYMHSKGFERKPRQRSPFAPGRIAAKERLENREVRSFEVEYVGGLWHLDIHHASRQISTERGEMRTPLALCVIDDHSRLCCHLQWYWQEDTRSLVHGFIQALQKRGLPRSLMTDNGSAMTSQEFMQGATRLGIQLENTLAYSPYQNGKQESFWGSLEGRMMAMLEAERNLSLETLNSVSQAWVEMEYNRRLHSETNETPLNRYLNGKSVLRISPECEVLRSAFRRDETRTQRICDGTFSLLGKRFEIPTSYRSFLKIIIRYAEWDLKNVHLIDPRTQVALAPLYPLDKLRNSNGLRRVITKTSSDVTEPSKPDGLPPLLQQLLSEYAASGLPPAYIADTESKFNYKNIHQSSSEGIAI